MERICLCCRKSMGKKEPLDDISETTGVCEECKEKLRKREVIIVHCYNEQCENNIDSICSIRRRLKLMDGEVKLKCTTFISSKEGVSE